MQAHQLLGMRILEWAGKDGGDCDKGILLWPELIPGSARKLLESAFAQAKLSMGMAYCNAPGCYPIGHAYAAQ